MISSLTALLIVFAAVIGSTAMMGILGYLLYRIRQIEAGNMRGSDPHELADHLTRMEEELLAARSR